MAWQYLYAHSFFGLDSLKHLLPLHQAPQGIYYKFGHDKTKESFAASLKPVLKLVNHDGIVMDEDMDTSRLCPPFCGPYEGCTLSAIFENERVQNKEQSLDLFRNYRDNFLSKHGPLVEMYYYVSPALIEAIEARTDAEKIYKSLMEKEIKKCSFLIEQNVTKKPKSTSKPLLITWSPNIFSVK